jgi:NAD(P)H-hydrate epimerase
MDDMKVCSVEDMKRLDETTIKKYGIPSETLMENAGDATYSIISEMFGVDNRSFLVFCGSGNNGGDGLVITRKLHSNGGEVEAILLENADNFKGAAKTNFTMASKIGISIKKIGDLKEVREKIDGSDAIVDAIFGTGLTRDVEGRYYKVIELINHSGKPVFSVDIPSGVNGNNGKVLGIAIRADYTVTFGLPKIGNVLYPGYEYCGELIVSHISFPPSIYEKIKYETNDPIRIPDRKEDGHKGDFGDTLFVAGAAGYYGAPYFSAMSFMGPHISLQCHF